MATIGDGRAPYESRVDGEKSRPFRREINEEPRNVLLEAGRKNSVGVSDGDGNSISDLEQMMNKRSFTRSEIQHLTKLLHSRACDNVFVENDATSLPIAQMASPQHPTTIENLPEDLLSKIFIRFLAKQLAQMRCVSKSWNALLSRPCFVKSHLYRSINNNGRILLAFYNKPFENSHSRYKRIKELPPYTAYPCQSPLFKLTNFTKLPSGPHKRINIIGAVDGLICFSYGDYFDDNVHAIHICNPSLSAVTTLPPYLFPYCSCYETDFRFGFDPKTNDYKVIKITGLKQPRETPGEYEAVADDFYDLVMDHVIKKWLRVEIYSMRTGCWKLITHTIPSRITRIINTEHVCVDGHDGRLHWVGYTNERLDSFKIVVAFDLGSETFLEMNLPDPVQDYDFKNRLGVLGGKLCVMSCSWSKNGGIALWVMNEYGVAESWVKRHVFSFPRGFISWWGNVLSGFTSRSEFLIEDRHKRHVLYDAVTGKLKILDEDIFARHGVDRIVEYVDSLVWIAPPRNIS